MTCYASEMASHLHNEHRYRRRYSRSIFTNMNIANIVKAIIVLIIVINTKVTDASEVSDKDELARRMKIIESVSGRFFSDVYSNGTFRTGNHLWDNILNQCSVKPSVSCLQKNVYSYLDEKLDFDGDVKVTNGMCFKKNNVDIKQYTKEANIIYLTGSKDKESERYLDEDNEIDNEVEPESPIEEVTDALYDKGVKFLTTHDMKLTLPEFFFDGATLKISPRALTKTGALVHIDLEPKEEPNGQSRLFFHKIKKYIRKKLVTAAIAIILVVKLIALKLIFVLPLILGVTTAKKMFLKLLLFIFPALSHIFKLCSWYHQNYHTTKYHHHHHLITHHHKAPHHPYSGHSGHGSLVVRPGTAPAHAPTFEHYPQDWELSGPGLGSEYLASDIHRNAIASFKPNVNDANDINAWGLGAPGPSMNLGEVAASSNNNGATANGQKLTFGPSARPVGPPNPYYRNKKIAPKDPLQAEKEALIRAASIASRAPPSPVRDEILRVSAVKLQENTRVKTETDLVKQQQQILAAEDPETIAAEQFYGAIIERVDSILSPIGAIDPGCKERAICSMYGDPFKHAPYSNLISNELSKDSTELITAGDSKMAMRFYRYVQAARDGQEQKDCLASYPQCDVNFNHK